ncbi:2,5-diketo-D-gluconate reductase A [Conyzicola lurida]|uniref:2,5-diketo-D-gluconate reductase A n=1 Tax=Conyzicola lurida TaxID=1172621 RepID=A0A841ASX0_9MICO|nr:aldo/keto reductase [Conyzicola lurida]MBB5845042.1 2,5-diketo-D-gluconate reductase A [Conyzicola lurida]
MTTSPFSPSLQLADGRAIPQFGLGVYKVDDSLAAHLVEGAIEAGYRHVDTAKLYFNEAGVGAGIRASGVQREEIFVTTKVWNDDQGYDETLRAFDTSLELLGLDYVDLYLIHWPAPAQDRYVETWRALETLKGEGRARSIGVSNFNAPHLDKLLANATETPVINQIELQPWLQQHELRAYNAAHGILTEAWSPLARGRVLDDPTLAAIGEKHGKTPAQVVLRWHVQSGVAVIPKSNSLDRIRENSLIFDFELDAADLAAIAALETGERTGSDPDTVG